jgi:hypothetical protein
MSNLLTFLDGATYASIWAVGPILVSCLLLEENGSADTAAPFGRPTSSEQALGLITTLFRPVLNPNSKQADSVNAIWKSIPIHISFVMVAYLFGRAVGNYVGRKNEYLHCMQRLCPRRIRSLSSNRILSLISSLLVLLLMMNWGFGIATYSGWVMIRFFTAFVNGCLMSWGKRYLSNSKENIDANDLQLMEEGHPFIHGHASLGASNKSSQQMWLEKYYLAGIASSSVFSGFVFYVLNQIGPHRKIFMLFVFSGLAAVTDRLMSRYFKTVMPIKRSTTSTATFDDVGIVQMSSLPAAGLVQRKKQSNPILQSQTPLRTRINSLSSVESEVFFDCLDDMDMELGYGESQQASPLIAKHNQKQVQPIKQDNTNQIAIYSNRRVVYSDDAPAFVPVGEKETAIPQGYTTLYGKNALSNYQQTKQWRRQQQIYRIHARPHLWYPKIKAAYPHYVHGFSKTGMPVIYESPGRMNLKELFRNGCQVDDMIFHYCYLMEYLSNLESILTELHTELNDACGDEWQEELAAYAHSKQQRIQTDQVSFGFVVVMDISGASPSLLSGDVMAYLSRAGEINSLHYPGSMRNAVAVQAPFWLGAAWGAIKGVMPASVSVDLLSATKTMEGGLKEYIDEDQIPVEYGGKSRFKLGEHPFQTGLCKLVETQPTEDIEDDQYSIQEMDSFVPETETYHDYTEIQSRSTQHVQFQEDATTADIPRTHVIEWDDLDADYVLLVATILFILTHMLIGAIEVALPLLLIIPPNQGAGFESRKIGATVSAVCMTILLILKRTRLSSRITCIIEKSPLSAFRIGQGSSCFFWIGISFVLSAAPPNASKIGVLCLIVYLTLAFFSTTLGVASVDYLRKISVESFAAGGEHTVPKWCSWMQYDSSTTRVSFFARVFGVLVAAPVIRWYIAIPIGSLCFVVLACVCGFLYVISFALHSVSPPPSLTTTRRGRKVSQFAIAMTGLINFIKDLIMVAVGDCKFLWKELRGKVQNK